MKMEQIVENVRENIITKVLSKQSDFECDNIQSWKKIKTLAKEKYKNKAKEFVVFLPFLQM